jgi:hypothetical protein
MIPIMFCSGIPRRNAIRGERLALDGRHAQQSEFVPNPVRTRAFPSKREVIENLGSLDWEISNADMAETDVIFDRHGAITFTPSWLED